MYIRGETRLHHKLTPLNKVKAHILGCEFGSVEHVVLQSLCGAVLKSRKPSTGRFILAKLRHKRTRLLPPRDGILRRCQGPKACQKNRMLLYSENQPIIVKQGRSHLQLARFQKCRISRLVPLQRSPPLAEVFALVDGVGGHED